MSNKPFNKALLFTDLHLGKKSNSEQFNQDCLDFLTWAIQKGKENNCDRVLFGGDFLHNRASIQLKTLHYAVDAVKMINDNFDRTDIIVGNHDLYYKDKRSVASIEWAKHLPNIFVHTDIYREGDLVLVPWLVNDEYKELKKLTAKHVIGHFELPKFKMNSMVDMPDHGTIQAEDLGGVEYVWSGHFHKRQSRKNIHYIGNAFPHDYSDAWDDERGIVILDWDGTHEYHTWDKAPTYKTLPLSSLLEHPELYLTPQSYLRINIDIPISYEEASFIRETFNTQYNPREMTLIPQKDDAFSNEAINDTKFESVNQIVHSQISTLESEFYDPKLLLQIYEGL